MFVSKLTFSMTKQKVHQIHDVDDFFSSHTVREIIMEPGLEQPAQQLSVGGETSVRKLLYPTNRRGIQGSDAYHFNLGKTMSYQKVDVTLNGCLPRQ